MAPNKISVAFIIVLPFNLYLSTVFFAKQRNSLFSDGNIQFTSVRTQLVSMVCLFPSYSI